ncbi:MAG: D-alanyl-D-alanine carboxypeptidase family protein [Janthinobacterium lividum]
MLKSSNILLIVLSLALLLLPLSGRATPPVAANPLTPVVHSHYSVLIDAVTGKVIWARNPETPRAIASTTKILTATLLLERGHLDDIVTAPNGVQYLPDSSLHLRVGEKITLRDLLYAMLLRSANDTAVAGAVYLSGSVPAFAKEMNAKAKEIGAVHSHFVTPNGLPAPGHYSTAGDMALLAAYAVNNLPEFNAIVRTPLYKVHRSVDQRDVWVKNTATTYLKTFPGADGIKTGYIHQAGHCFVGSATRGGWRLIGVALDSNDCREDVESLLNYGFTNFAPMTVLHQGDPVGTISIPSASQPVNVSCSDPVFIVVSKRRPMPGYQIKVTPLPLLPQAPISAGTRLGTVTILVDGKVQATAAALATDNVALRPSVTVVETIKMFGLILLKAVGALALLIVLIFGGLIVYGRTASKSARSRRNRFAANVRGVDRPGPGAR